MSDISSDNQQKMCCLIQILKYVASTAHKQVVCYLKCENQVWFRGQKGAAAAPDAGNFRKIFILNPKFSQLLYYLIYRVNLIVVTPPGMRNFEEIFILIPNKIQLLYCLTFERTCSQLLRIPGISRVSGGTKKKKLPYKC